MEAKFHYLPPHKRFTRQREQFEDNKENLGGVDLQLPAKKRKGPREPLRPLYPLSATTSVCLPTKKRVWAMTPELLPGSFFSPLDLNVEYKPLLGEQTECTEDNNNIILEPGDGKAGINPLASAGQFPGTKSLEKSGLDTFVTETGGEGKSEVERCATVVINAEEEGEPEICRDPPGLEKLEDESESLPGDVKVKNELEWEDGISCAVCQSTDGDPTDPIVFCDGCDLMTHATCYGNPLVGSIPEGDWYCAACIHFRNNQSNIASNGHMNSLSCCLCNRPGGALKRTIEKNGSWAHLVCALYVPEVFFNDPDGREGINYSEVPKRRWQGKCYVCKGKKGCVIQCSEQNCPLQFHVTCGLSESLSFEYKQGKNKTVVAGFCKRHSELWEKQQQSGKFKIVAM